VNKGHQEKEGVERDLSSMAASSLLAYILFLRALLFSFFDSVVQRQPKMLASMPNQQILLGKLFLKIPPILNWISTARLSSVIFLRILFYLMQRLLKY
jgi:hypothetical protein